MTHNATFVTNRVTGSAKSREVSVKSVAGPNCGKGSGEEHGGGGTRQYLLRKRNPESNDQSV